jgi:hypothetical protein
LQNLLTLPVYVLVNILHWYTQRASIDQAKKDQDIDTKNNAFYAVWQITTIFLRILLFLQTFQKFLI